MKRTLTIAMLLVCAGCGRTALEQAKVVGLAARQTAESAYLTVRVEYLLGHVDEATMAEARRLYTRFRLAQSAYVEALTVWEAGGRPDDLDALKDRIRTLAADLHALADGQDRKDLTRQQSAFVNRPTPEWPQISQIAQPRDGDEPRGHKGTDNEREIQGTDERRGM